jgi:hypothetical protein
MKTTTYQDQIKARIANLEKMLTQRKYVAGWEALEDALRVTRDELAAAG